jgi:hypothetical protein
MITNRALVSQLFPPCQSYTRHTYGVPHRGGACVYHRKRLLQDRPVLNRIKAPYRVVEEEVSAATQFRDWAISVLPSLREPSVAACG